jgi:hypothetical protein
MHQMQSGVLNVIAPWFPTGALPRNELPETLLFKTASRFNNINIAAMMKTQKHAEFLLRKGVFIPKKAKRYAIIFLNEGA